MDRTLAELGAGERGVVTALCLSSARAAPFVRLGLMPGTEVQCLRRSPMGDPSVYRFRGTTVALRRLDTRQILVQPERSAPYREYTESGEGSIFLSHGGEHPASAREVSL